jgi:hypothetical protein
VTTVVTSPCAPIDILKFQIKDTTVKPTRTFRAPVGYIDFLLIKIKLIVLVIIISPFFKVTLHGPFCLPFFFVDQIPHS